MKKRRLTQAQKKKLISLVVVVVVIAAAGILTYNGRSIQPLIEYFPFLEEIFPQQNVPAGAPASPGEEGVALRVHILDVGQADCILIQGPEKTMVIDGGESSDGPDIIQYLRDQGVERIDYYLNTHPHSDHYGGITQVMEAIPTGEFFHHPVPEEHTPTTRGYQKLISYLAESKTKTTVLDPGDTVALGNGAVLTILAPLEEYDDMNNNSLVGRLTYGENAFLFTGDAEKKSEKVILESGAELWANVYSIPHHGSNTGMTQKFLDAVNPQYATISVGKDNDYGHPHQETIERLQKAGVPCLRTDLYGAIVFTSDGRTLTVESEKGEYRKAG
ncbi:MAG: MBL fold metallo-hydrolase [Angelakisella sp.]|nr:MBL fold metallo-hydrolase [Angelakisella sp.]